MYLSPYRSFIGYAIDFDELVYSCKKLIIEVPLASELAVLTNALSRIALSNCHTCDFTLNSLRNALSEIIASFPIYRTYGDDSHISDLDREYIQNAVGAARRRSREDDVERKSENL